MKIIAVILVKDEELHLQRALDSILGVVDNVLIVDSGSSDRTVEIARAAGLEVAFNPWVNYASQFNWALGQIAADFDWILRLDADEILSPELAASIRPLLEAAPPNIEGAFLDRRMTFMRKPIRWGGVFPVRVLRVFRNGRGHCENRWMDEHIVVTGECIKLPGELLDDSLHSLTWWTDKHNRYACREAVDALNLKYGFMPLESVGSLSSGQQASVKRWVKEHVYSALPTGFRAFLYFFYRGFLRLGFLDGKEGLAFHVLQGFWYRYLVDMKIQEVERAMAREGWSIDTAIRNVLAVDVNASTVSEESRGEHSKISGVQR